MGVGGTGPDGDGFTGFEVVQTGFERGFDGCSKRLGVRVTLLFLCAGNLDLGESSGAGKLLVTHESLLRTRLAFLAARLLGIPSADCNFFSHPPRALLDKLPLGCAVGLAWPGTKVGGITPEFCESSTLLLLLLRWKRSFTCLALEVSAL